jgi:thiol:disulfide interchange protein DsbC
MTLHRFFITAALTLLSLLTTAAPAQSAQTLEAKIKAAVEANTQGKLTIDSVTKSPIPGLFELTSGPDILYVDAAGRYAIEGQLIDLQTQRDLTRERQDKLSRIDFSKLPLTLAIKTVRGNGKRTLAIFEDPLCQVCRVLHQFMAQLTDVTLYTFIYPVTGPESVPLAQAAWCAPDRQKTWHQLMGNTPAQSLPPPTQCDLSGLEKIQQLGNALHVNATPTVFLSNGKRLIGATPPEQFIAELDASALPITSPTN